MRELKFRAWNTIDNVMVYDLNSPSLKHGILEEDDYILLQYTGLKDKSGKEIYEGDIFKIIGSSHDFIGKVIYSCELAGYFIKFEDGEQCGLFEWNELTHIIGNIYENPELMEK